MVNSINTSGIVSLVENSPLLVTFIVCACQIIDDGQYEVSNLKVLAMLKGRFSRRKLFTFGNCHVKQCNVEQVHYQYYIEDIETFAFPLFVRKWQNLCAKSIAWMWNKNPPDYISKDLMEFDDYHKL